MRLTVDVHQSRSRRSISVCEHGRPVISDVFFDIQGIDLPPVDCLDFAALATLFFAMRRGQDLHINGPVSAGLLRNLEEFQRAWAMWRPMYKVVTVTASQEPDPPRRPERKAVFAYSGGVDGTFALLRHQCGLAGRRNCVPVAACMIQGLDAGQTETEAMAIEREAAKRVLDSLGIPFALMRTNWTAQLCGVWANEFGSWLGACLHQFSGIANYGVFGADEDYAHLSFPWGSNPATNPFLSGSAFEIMTEGGGFTRTERVALIAETPEIAKQLRVCWQGPRTGGNCGKCEKCIRTKMNFMALGHEPVCFEDGRPTTMDILGIKCIGKVSRDYLVEILQTARKRGITEPWTRALAITIGKNLVTPIPRALMRLVRRA